MNIKNLIKEISYIIDNNITIANYAKEKKISRNKFSRAYKKLKHNTDELSKKFCSLYLSINNKKLIIKNNCEAFYERDNSGKIIRYSYKIYRINKPPVIGSFNREEMDLIYRLYTNHGAQLTQKQVNRHFPDIIFSDFQSILRAFKITKADAYYAPHKAEECTEEELLDIKRNIINQKVIANIERNNVKNLEKENIQLYKEREKILGLLKNFKFKGFETNNYVAKECNYSEKSIMLNIADMHVGASLESNAIYKNDYNYNVITERLNKVIDKLKELGSFDIIHINVLGDMLDGMNKQTARLGHILEQNMDNHQQINSYLDIMYNFVNNIKNNIKHNFLTLYCVPNGNHTGTTEYVTNKFLCEKLNNSFDNIQCYTSDKDISHFQFNGEYFIVLHGKDEKHQRRPYPKEMNDFVKVKFYEYCEYNGIPNNVPVYILKGDLHTDNINSDIKFVYRNCLSLFGSSDYANANFTRNPNGVSYELFINNNHLHGSFKNL